MTMQRMLLAIVTLLLGAHACLAQVSTMGTTAMGLPSTPATIVTSPLSGPSPFSATILPGTPDTTLAPVPLASDPTTPGTVVTCAPPTGQIAPGTPTGPSIPMTPAMLATSATVGTMPTNSAAPATSALPPIAVPPLTFSQQPETSAMTVFPGSTIPVPPPPALPPLPLPSITPVPVPVLSPVPGAVPTDMSGTTAMTASTSMMPPTAMAPAVPLGTIPSPIVTTTTGNISPAPPLGSQPSTVC